MEMSSEIFRPHGYRAIVNSFSEALRQIEMSSEISLSIALYAKVNSFS